MIGGGIVGVSTAYNLITKRPGSRVLLVEKADYLAAEQTGHNSGVIHAGVYYTPGSLKAKFCKIGSEWTKEFCKENNIPYEVTGKMIVATNLDEVFRMHKLYNRAVENGIKADLISNKELREREPNIKGMEAIYVHDTGIVDYRKVTRKLADKFLELGGEIRLKVEVEEIHESSEKVTLQVKDRNFGSGVRYHLVSEKLVVCGGIQADRLARSAGLNVDWRMIPFRGEYYKLPEKYNDVVNSLIYPIPEPGVPFLGVHLTKMIDGSVTVGPNAVLGLSRSGYEKLSLNIKDMIDFARYPGFWRLAKNNLKTGASEAFNSTFKKGYLREVRKYCPQIKVEDLTPYPPGIRAQAVDKEGNMIEDFDIRETNRTLHVVNAPSPAATSAMPIGDYISAKSLKEEPKY